MDKWLAITLVGVMTAIAVPAGIEKYMEGKATIAGYEAITAAEKAGDTATCTILTDRMTKEK